MRTRLFLSLVLLSLSSFAAAQSGMCVGISSETVSGSYTVLSQDTGSAYQITGWWQALSPGCQTLWELRAARKSPRTLQQI